MSNTSNLIDLIQHDKLDKANDMFKELVSSKMADAIQTQKIEVAKTLLAPEQKETE